MAATRLSSARQTPLTTRSMSPESTQSVLTVDALSSSSNAQSSSSTPPTSAADSASIASASLKSDQADGAAATGRSRRARNSSVATYNVKQLSGTTSHTPKKFLKNRATRDEMVTTRRRTISGDTLVSSLESNNTSTESVVKDANKLVSEGIEALDLQWADPRALPKSWGQIGRSPKKGKAAKRDDLARRRSTRSAGEPVESLTKRLSVLGKRGRNVFEAGIAKGKRELKRLADTNEYAGVETKPVITEVWANGKLVVPGEPPSKKLKVEPAEKKEAAPAVEKKKSKAKKDKIWLNKGLYAGQDGAKDYKKKIAAFPEYKPNSILPMPMWAGERLLHVGRDFKLPWDICSPLPPGQPKPDEWKKFSKNRFVGDAAAAWKKSTLFDDFASRCVCSSTGICDDSCQNRIMLYECDNANCSAGAENCTNRAFTQLQERRSKGGKYRIGVEVIKTSDRGYGVRSNRCYEPHQIIVEYAGEIITEEECDRRMNEDYKDNDCYYLMSFDQNMIIDGTRGSIARFVNHSCEPNCRIVKWIVAGKPRMALFAGDRPIMTGDELTYDYNFDPFSAKNVQECRCGAKNCRGVLGPRPKDQKPTKAAVAVGRVVKRVVSAGKRKLKEFLGGEADENASLEKLKKRKIATPVRKSASARAFDSVKGLSKSLSKSIGTTTKRKSPIRKSPIASSKTSKTGLKTYGGVKRQTVLSSRNSSLTIVASEDNTLLSPKGRGKGEVKKSASMLNGTLKKNVVRSLKARTKKGLLDSSITAASKSTIRTIAVAGEEED